MRTATLAVLVMAAVHTAMPAQTAERIRYRLVFPPITLNSEQWQAMDGLHFTVACGHIESLSWVPERWNVEIVRAISEVEEFRATAGLGTARLLQDHIRQFSGAITISASERECFKVSGAITIGGEKHFDIPLTNANLSQVAVERK